MSRYVARLLPRVARGVTSWWLSSPSNALDERLARLVVRGQHGERCRVCLDCSRGCGVLCRPVRRGWKITHRSPT